MGKLSVRLSGTFGERNITNEVVDLAYRSEAMGGFASASFRLARPIHVNSPELAALNKVYVYDVRSPWKVAWQGYLEDPGRAADGKGLVWTVNAVGPSSRLKDAASPICYVDRRIDAWRRGPETFPTRAAFESDHDRPDGFTAPGWRLRNRNGAFFPVGICGAICYELLEDSGQHIGRVHVFHHMGNNDTNWHFAIGATGGATGYEDAAAIEWSTTGTDMFPVITTHFDTDRTTVWALTNRITSSVTVTDDTTYTFIKAIVVRGTLFNKTGSELTAGADYNVDHVTATQVVSDILGRWMSTYDRANANIATTTFQIEQLAWTDPIRPQEILEELTALEPLFRYAVWGETPIGGNEFEYVLWDSGDILEYDPADGFTSPESSSDMYSDVTVRYNDGVGKIRSYKATQTVPALQGLRRYGIVDLSSEKGVSSNNTAQAASAFLAEHNTPSNSGTLTVARPILNTTRGIMVNPWMIRPGTLLRLRGVQARPDYLNASTRNGVTMFRVVATEYSTSSGTATLELENFNPTLARQLADAKRAIEHSRMPFFSFA